jgi:diketogulonate reductase-like aldo/keto reductase
MIPGIKLANGTEIPQVGLGLWKITDEAVFMNAFTAAVAAGYRHFDDAQAYGNEQFLGEAWKASRLRREELFITTKILPQNFGYKKTHKSFDVSLEKLQTDYVDLLLLHFPGLSWLRTPSWRALEEILGSDRAKAIGVSNFKIKHLEVMKRYAHDKPIVNQVELHVFLQQPELLQYCKENNIVVEAYSPLAHSQVMNDPTILAIASKYGKSYAQIMLRWCVQQGAVVIPKSTGTARLQENIDIFNFELDVDDITQLTKLNRNMRTVWRSILFG